MSEECANPLLLAWVKEWLDKAKEQNSKGLFTYRKAYDSIRACPIAFDHPSEAQELRGLGPKLCERLTEKLKEHCQQNDLPMPADPRKAKKRKSNEANDDNNAVPAETEPPKAKKPRKTTRKQYVPSLRTGPYAIILALSTLSEDSNDGMTKSHIIELAQPHCESSFTAPSDPTKTYTAWSSMKTLQGKDLVYMAGGARKYYSLTDEGWEVAKKVKLASGLTNEAIKNPGDSGGEIRVLEAELAPQSSQPLLEINIRQRNKQISSFVDFDNLDEEEPATVSRHEPEELAHSRSEKTGSIRPYTETDYLEILSSSPKLLPEKPPDCRAPLQPESIQTLNKDKQNTKDFNNQTAAFSLYDHTATLVTDDTIPSFTPIPVPPDLYTIELLLDNREVRSKTDRDYIQSGLLTHGIRPTTVALPVGDALWVARLSSSSFLSSHGEEGSGLVLSHILERKRLDDLLGSIKDGRFAEQKFRLKKSGIENVVYLVEDYNLGADTKEAWHEHVCSAVASTMVVSGMFVKRTRSLDESIRYLAGLTRTIRERYRGKTLYLVPSAVLPNASMLKRVMQEKGNRRKEEADSLCVTYEAFGNLASKSESLTLRDVFLKMLMCVRGVTGEKALEIQRVWPTPRELVEALRKEDSGMAREEMVWRKLGGNVGRKKIGKAISRKVAEVWSGC